MQDLTAEIIGETNEPESFEEPTLQILDDRTFLVQAQTDLEEVNELLNLDLPLDEDYQTVGGFVIYHLQKIPAQGEMFRYRDYEMTVESAEGPRLERIRIQRLESAIAGDEDWLSHETTPELEAVADHIQPESLPDPWEMSDAGEEWTGEESTRDRSRSDTFNTYPDFPNPESHSQPEPFHK
jgi:hypothetical protein